MEFLKINESNVVIFYFMIINPICLDKIRTSLLFEYCQSLSKVILEDDYSRDHYDSKHSLELTKC